MSVPLCNYRMEHPAAQQGMRPYDQAEYLQDSHCHKIVHGKQFQFTISFNIYYCSSMVKC